MVWWSANWFTAAMPWKAGGGNIVLTQQGFSVWDAAYLHTQAALTAHLGLLLDRDRQVNLKSILVVRCSHLDEQITFLRIG